MAEIRGERWHVGKEMPIAVIVGFIIQILLTGIWIGKLETKVEQSSEFNKELRQELKELSYQVAALTIDKHERERDNNIIHQKFQILNDRLDRIERRYK